MSTSQGLRPRTVGASDAAVGPVLCQRLRGEPYSVYLFHTSTRTLGGISFEQRARMKRQLFPYKYPSEIKQEHDIPLDGNAKVEEKDWTLPEQRRLDRQLQGFARWIVDFDDRSVRSTTCEGNTRNAHAICDKCTHLAKDESLKHAIRRVELSKVAYVQYLT